MKKYSVLTKYINLLGNDNVGEWNCDKENDGSAERPIQLPFVIYSITVNKLADDIYKFAKESDEIVPSKDESRCFWIRCSMHIGFTDSFS